MFDTSPKIFKKSKGSFFYFNLVIYLGLKTTGMTKIIKRFLRFIYGFGIKYMNKTFVDYFFKLNPQLLDITYINIDGNLEAVYYYYLFDGRKYIVNCEKIDWLTNLKIRDLKNESKDVIEIQAENLEISYDVIKKYLDDNFFNS